MTPETHTAANLRSALEQERTDLQQQLGDLGVGADSAELTYDANFADSSQVTAERGENEALIATLKDSLTAVEGALDRMDQGTYGVCERCGGPITDARLEAMPTATRCINCASLP
jgi:RNA polymerase-binding transcription factor DksA